jgi:hypothetical protein
MVCIYVRKRCVKLHVKSNFLTDNSQKNIFLEINNPILNRTFTIWWFLRSGEKQQLFSSNSQVKADDTSWKKRRNRNKQRTGSSPLVGTELLADQRWWFFFISNSLICINIWTFMCFMKSSIRACSRLRISGLSTHWIDGTKTSRTSHEVSPVTGGTLLFDQMHQHFPLLSLIKKRITTICDDLNLCLKCKKRN